MADLPGSTAPKVPPMDPPAVVEADALQAHGREDVWHRIKEHKVVQWTLAYAATAYTLLHGTEMVSEALEWPHVIARILTLVLVVGVPVVITLAWYHGAKSLRRVSGPELTIIAILLFIAGSILWLFSVRHAEQAATDLPATSAHATDRAAARPGTTPTVSAGRNTSTAKPRIAVLPFSNLSPDPNNAFFTEGLHEEILTALANAVPDLEVISRTTINTYKDKSVSVEELSKELNCAYVLEGSVRREAEEVRLTVQLIDARNDSHVWAQNFDRKLVKAMTLESEVAAAVATRLSIKIGAAAPAQTAVTTDPLAYDLYLKARAAEDSTGGPDLRNAEKLLDQAIGLDASLVRAYVERIVIHVSWFLGNEDTGEKNLAQAHRDFETVRRLAPQDAVVSAAQAILAFAELDYDHALQLFNAAESAGLSDPRLLDWKASLLFAMGRYEEATALSRRLVELDPKNWIALGRWNFMVMELHQGREAMRVAELGVVMEPQSSLWKANRAVVLFQFGGDLEPFKQVQDPQILELWHAPDRLAGDLGNWMYVLNLEHRFGEARRLIDTLTVDTWNQKGWDWPLTRVGRTPIADVRGWEDLLLGDATEAKRDGQRILKFLNNEPETKWNAWFRTLLRAEARLFMGDGASAIRTANDAVAITRAGPDVSDQMNADVWATQIMAWAGSTDEAATRLERLATSVPGLWPGEIACNPLWTVPLTHSERYNKLRDRLDVQMKATKLE